MISANGGLPAHRYTPQVTPRWPRGSEPASARWRLLSNAPPKGHHSHYITLFFKGTYSLGVFFALMGVFLVSLMHFLGEFWGYLTLYPWSY